MSEVFTVYEVSYHLHTKKGAGPSAPKTMRVSYRVGAGPEEFISEWICFEHFGFPRTKAENWWRARTDLQMPATSAEAVEIARSCVLAKPKEIQVEKDGEFRRVVGYKLVDADAELPPLPETYAYMPFNEEDYKEILIAEEQLKEIKRIERLRAKREQLRKQRQNQAS